jgi:hypothetical protein
MYYKERKNKKHFYFMEAASHPLAGIRRVTRPTAKLADGNNIEKAPLTFQRLAVEAENARIKAMQLSETGSELHGDASLPTLTQSSQLPPAIPSLASTRPTSPGPLPVATPSDTQQQPERDSASEDDTPPTRTGTKHRRPATPIALELLSSDSDDEQQEKREKAPKKKKKKRSHTANDLEDNSTYKTLGYS